MSGRAPLNGWGTAAERRTLGTLAWYKGLAKPGWTPPDAAIGVIWTALLGLAVAGGVAARRDAPDAQTRRGLLALFAVNGALNLGWAGLFFGARRPDWALAEDSAFWLSTAALTAAHARVSRPAGLLLAPYLIWATAAVVLNAEVVRRNAPFRDA